MRILLSSFLLLATLGPAAQSGMPAETAEREALALENAWNQAVQLGESRAVEPLLMEGMVYIDYDGRIMNKGQYLSQVLMPVLRPEHIVSESMRARAYGNSVIVTGIYKEQGKKNGKPYALRERFVDAWIRQHGMWVCVSSQSTLILH